MKAETLTKHFGNDFKQFYERYIKHKMTASGKDHYTTTCPFHNDHRDSFNFQNSTGLWNCFACNISGNIFHFYSLISGLNTTNDFPKILEGIADDFGIEYSKIDKIYDYSDENGTLLYQVVKMKPKSFRQRRPDGNGGWIWNTKNIKTVLYNLPGIKQSDNVFIVEGEKDADNFNNTEYRNSAATTSVRGAGRWKDEYNECLKEKNVYLIPDNDKQGRAHMHAVGNSLTGVVKTIKWINLTDVPDKGDLSDYLANYSKEDAILKIGKLISKAKPFKPIEKPVEEVKLDFDLGNLEGTTLEYIVIETFSKICPFYYDDNKLWWLWNTNLFAWQRGNETDLLNELNKWRHVKSTNTRYKACLMEAFRQIGRLNQPKQAPKSWIQFKNTIVDIETGEEFEATPEYFITNPIPWKLGDREETPTIDKLFHDWIKPQDVSYVDTLYEILSYCIIPDYPLHRIIALIGGGSNGKSSYLKLIEKFLGERNCCASNIFKLMIGKFNRTILYKKLFCSVSEINKGIFKYTEELKTLTGDDTVEIEFKRKDSFNTKNYAKIVMAGNNDLPETTDKSDGFFRRWLVVDFKNQFEDGKDIIKDVPEYEFSNLAKKSVRVLKGLIDRGRFTKEGNIQERRERYEARSSRIDSFINEHCEITLSENDYITLKEFKEKYNNYLINGGLTAKNGKTIAKILRDKEYEVRRTTRNKGTKNYIFGVKWQNDDEDDDCNGTIT